MITNNFITTWALGADALVASEVSLAIATNNPNVATYGPRTIVCKSSPGANSQHGAAYMIAPNSDANRGNSELLTIMEVGASMSLGLYRAGLVLRGSGANATETGYVCWFDYGNSRLVIDKMYNGTAFNLGNLNFALPSSIEDWYLRFRVNGSQGSAGGAVISAKVWRYDAQEPIDWQFTFSDTDTSKPVPELGFIGFYTRSAGLVFDGTRGQGFAGPGFISAGTNGETAPRPLSYIEQRQYFNDDGNPRVLLAEVSVLGQDAGGSALASQVLMSTWPALTESSDTPANQTYDDIIVQAPVITSKASEQLVGHSTMSVGDCIIKNEDGVRDHWLFWNWDGRPFDMYVGGLGWRRWDFIKVASLVTSEIYVPSKDQLGLKIRDKSALLNRKVQTQVLGGTGANSGQPKPITWGHAFNVEPQLIDAATFRYKFHDESLAGAVGIEQVRNNGLSVSFTDQGNGEFTLNADPAGGQITASVKVDISAGSTTRAGATHPRLLQTLAEDRAGLGSGSSYLGGYSGSLALFGGDPTDEIGLFAKGDENIMALMDQAATSAGGFWYFNELGLLCAAHVQIPVGPYFDHTLIEDDVQDFKIEKLFLPSEAQQLGYQKNWTVQSSGFAGAVTAADRVLYASPAQYTVVTPAYAGLDQPANHLLRARPVAADTLFHNVADANDEVTRRDGIYRKTTALVSFLSKVDFLNYNLGQSVFLTYPRYGFDAGKAGQVMGAEKTFTKGTRVTLFVQFDGQFPVVEAGTPYVGVSDFY